MFFPARHDHWLVQTGDGYAAHVAGAIGVSTDAQASWWGSEGVGTVPHALIAAYGGDTVLATRKFAEQIGPEVKLISLVDFDNDCVNTSLRVAEALGDRLYGVRLDTSEMLVDRSLFDQMGSFKPTGVNPQLVWNVRRALDAAGFNRVRIVVSGGLHRGQDPGVRAAGRAGGRIWRRLVALSGPVRLHRRRRAARGQAVRQGGEGVPAQSETGESRLTKRERGRRNWGCMTKLIFWDVDTLHDFMKSDGKLYVPGSEEIIPAVKALTDFAHANRIPIVASADNHELSDAEISDTPDWKTTFPPHCMRGTPGQLKIAETELPDPLVIEPELQDPGALAQQILAHTGDFLLHKRALDVFSNANVPTLLRALEPEAVVIYGVATDFCDKYVVEGLSRELPRAELFLVTDAVRAIYPDEGERLIAGWRERGVRMITVAQILEENALELLLPGRSPAPAQ